MAGVTVDADQFIHDANNELEVKIERQNGKLFREKYYKNNVLHEIRTYDDGILSEIGIYGNDIVNFTRIIFNYDGKISSKTIYTDYKYIEYEYSLTNENKLVKITYSYYSNLGEEPYLIEEFNEKFELIKTSRHNVEHNNIENNDGNI